MRMATAKRLCSRVLIPDGFPMVSRRRGRLLSDLPNYGDWLPGSAAYGATTDVEPYPVRRGSRYHDGKPGEAGTMAALKQYAEARAGQPG